MKKKLLILGAGNAQIDLIEYAKDKGFAGAKTKEEFLQKAPVSAYDDYRPYIQENLKI